MIRASWLDFSTIERLRCAIPHRINYLILLYDFDFTIHCFRERIVTDVHFNRITSNEYCLFSADYTLSNNFKSSDLLVRSMRNFTEKPLQSNSVINEKKNRSLFWNDRKVVYTTCIVNGIKQDSMRVTKSKFRWTTFSFR